MTTIDPRRDAQPTSKDMTAPTTGHLIAGGKVSGTDVYSLDAEHIGSIEDVMLDKQTGRVSYAVLSFGGFLGLGLVERRVGKLLRTTPASICRSSASPCSSARNRPVCNSGWLAIA